MSRIALTDIADTSSAAREFMSRRGQLNVFRLLAGAPRVFEGWTRMVDAQLDSTTLPPRLRELVILRVASLQHSGYETAQHIGVARRAGVTDSEITTLTSDGPVRGFDPAETAVLVFTTELVTAGSLGAATFTIDGSHAERIAVPIGALSRKPKNLSFEEASVVGVNFVVGWLGAVETANVGPGQTIAIFGLRGGVGSAVAQIAHMRGARVLGVDRVTPAADAPVTRAIDELVLLPEDPAPAADELRRATGGRGVDIVYDAVGGVTTPAALAALAPSGCLVVISAIGTRTVEIDLIDLYHRELRLYGVDSRTLDLTASAQRLDLFTPYFEDGQFRPPPIGATFDLDDGLDAYRAVADRVPGRVVIHPSPIFA